MGIFASLIASLATSPVAASGKHAALVLDANSGQILYQNAADAPRYPASLAKMMTLYLVFERLEQGKLQYPDQAQDVGLCQRGGALQARSGAGR